jgi:hypothetical protein
MYPNIHYLGAVRVRRRAAVWVRMGEKLIGRGMR